MAHPQWEYVSLNGPENWSSLDEKYSTCGIGKTQSPIDLRSNEVTQAVLPAIEFDYKPSPFKLINNGHSIQVNYAPGSSINIGRERYELLQFHFHKPS